MVPTVGQGHEHRPPPQDTHSPFLAPQTPSAPSRLPHSMVSHRSSPRWCRCKAPGSPWQQLPAGPRAEEKLPIASNCPQLAPVAPTWPSPTQPSARHPALGPGGAGCSWECWCPGAIRAARRHGGSNAPAGVSTAPCPSSAPLPAPPGQTWAEPADFLSPKHSCRLCRDKDLAEASLPQGRASCWRWGHAGALLPTFPVNSGVPSHCWASGTAQPPPQPRSPFPLLAAPNRKVSPPGKRPDSIK